MKRIQAREMLRKEFLKMPSVIALNCENTTSQTNQLNQQGWGEVLFVFGFQVEWHSLESKTKKRIWASMENETRSWTIRN